MMRSLGDHFSWCENKVPLTVSVPTGALGTGTKGHPARGHAVLPVLLRDDLTDVRGDACKLKAPGKSLLQHKPSSQGCS